MGIRTQHGFTVIEVMLFLAVTGLLAVGILVGSGVSIGQQRYRDSVNSLKSFIQDQYNETTNVKNGRDSAWACDSSTAVTEDPGGTGQSRGTSDCVLLGRFMTVDASGTKINVASVVGYRGAGATAASDVLELQTNYKLGISPIDQEEKDVEWGAQIVKPKTAVPMPVSILIIRSPLSGAVMTFTGDGVVSNLNTLIKPENLQQVRDLCVNADAGSFVGKRAEVQISAYASSQAAILIPQEGASVCD
jgi:type II secretory pathway pseudopilin PulG